MGDVALLPGVLIEGSANLTQQHTLASTVQEESKAHSHHVTQYLYRTNVGTNIGPKLYCNTNFTAHPWVDGAAAMRPPFRTALFEVRG